MTAAGAWKVASRFPRADDPLKDNRNFYTVVPMDLTVRLFEDGELEAVHNIDIKCEVDNEPAIQTLIDEGTAVKKGDVLMTLDSSDISQKIEDTALQLEQVKADLITAQELLEIQKNQNAADLEAAQVNVQLATLDLAQYDKGMYPEQLQTAQTEYQMAQLTYSKAEETLSQTRELFRKQFVTETAVKNDQMTVTTAQNELDKAKTTLKVLKDYSREIEMAVRRNNLSQGQQRLATTRRVNANHLSQREAEVRTQQRTLGVLQRRMSRYQAQFAACTIKAPADGLVIYGSTFDRWNRGAIQIGNSVRREQLLFRLPDKTAMKAVVLVQEAQRGRIKPGMPARVKVVGIPTPIDALVTKISVLPDASAYSFNPDLRVYTVELALASSPSVLKPGLGLTAEIETDQLNSVAAVPMAAIHTSGQDRYIFVKNGNEVEPRKVTIGKTTDRFAELLDGGVHNGEEVLTLGPNDGNDLLAHAGILPSPQTPLESHPASPPDRGLANGKAQPVRPPGNSG